MSFLILEMNLANTYMCRLLFIKIKSSITASKLLSAVIVISIVASMFCINVMLGYSEELYRESYDASWYSTICVTNMDASECEAINDYITSVKQYKIGSSLAFSQADDVIVIMTQRGVLKEAYKTEIIDMFTQINTYLQG